MPSLEIIQVDVEMESDGKAVFVDETSLVKKSAESNDPEKPQATEAKLSEAPSLSEVPGEAAKSVTPWEDSTNAAGESKQKQQRKVNQMTLDTLFFGVNKSKSRQHSPVPKKQTDDNSKSPSEKKPIEGNGASTATLDAENNEKTEQENSLVTQKQTKIDAKLFSAKKTPQRQASAATDSDTTELKKAEKETKKSDDVEESEEDPEVWDLERVLDSSERSKVICNAKDCTAEAVAFWKSTKGSQWYTCESCQVDEFGGWPESTEPATKPKASTTKSNKKTSKSSSIEVTNDKENENEQPFELPEERKVLLQKYSDMKTRYSRRSKELVEEGSKGLAEEDFVMPEPIQKKEESTTSEDKFPDYVVANMAILIEGSSLPLSKLTDCISDKLFQCHEKKWDKDALTSKIKLLATRKAYIDIKSPGATVDLFEDEVQDRMWRWEMSTPEILPSEVLPKVRKARSARKKLSSHRTATTRLIQALSDAESWIGNVKLPKMDKHIAKVSQNEEKVLKFEREAEKKRMAEQAKMKKQEEIEAKKRKKQEDLEAKKKEKELEKERKKEELERKKQEAEMKRAEAEAKKQEAAKAREEAKQKKIAEKEEKKRLEDEKKRAVEETKKKKLTMQKACLMSFFAGPPSKKAKTEAGSSGDPNASNPEETYASSKSSIESFDVDSFRSMIDAADSHNASSPPFKKLSSQATLSRKRRTRNISLSVYVTVMPEQSAFDAQPFAELREIVIPNKYRFLSFHEDCRPPYHGTWSKSSRIVTGRNPFGKDTKYLDYDYDSEAEWEEGDDEVGEDIEDEGNCQEEDEEEGDARLYDYDDGFCVSDDRYLDIDEEVDEETKELYKKKLQTGQGSTAGTVCIIAPAKGGIPATAEELSTSVIEGFEKNEGISIMSSHKGKELVNAIMCLDAFPPAMIDEVPPPAQPEAPSATKENLGKDEYSREAMILLARFAHHCELNSKEKLIEALRTENPDTFSSRAKATRKLDSIAIKKRRVYSPGVYWEVKKEVLEQLGLQELLSLNPDPEPPKKEEPNDESAKGDNSSKGPKKGAKSKGKKRKPSGKAAVDGSAKKKQKKANKTQEKPASPPKKEAPVQASANVMASFLVRKKPKAAVTEEKPASPPKKETSLKASANVMAGFLVRKKPKNTSLDANLTTAN